MELPAGPLRWRPRLGPVQIGGRLGLPTSAVHAVLVRNRLNRLAHTDWVTGEALRRYEHGYPGLDAQVVPPPRSLTDLGER